MLIEAVAKAKAQRHKAFNRQMKSQTLRSWPTTLGLHVPTKPINIILSQTQMTQLNSCELMTKVTTVPLKVAIKTI